MYQFERSRLPSISLQALDVVSSYLPPMSLAVSVPSMRSTESSSAKAIHLGRNYGWAIAQLH